DWDLMGFDPRGINKTSPQVRCFSSSTDYNFFVANTALEQVFTVSSSSNLSGSTVEAQLIEQSREFIVLKKSQAKLCAKNMGDDLRYMGTATVVRDIDFMAKIFDGEDGKINFWGVSYRSILRLGAYLVNMLPDRVGFVVIDRIVDPVHWSTEPSHKWPFNWLSSAEKTYRFYLKACSLAGPGGCPLTKYQNELCEQIEARIEYFFDRVAVAPSPVPFGSRLGYLTSGAARVLLAMSLEHPQEWPESAFALAQAMDGNGTLLLNKLLTPRPAPTPDYDLVRLGVTCLDSPPPQSPAEIPTAEDLAAQILKTMREVSPHFGASMSIGEPDGGCQYWPVCGPKRFTRPWNASLDWPMLILKNVTPLLRRVTPIKSGHRLNSLMLNSTRMIIQDGPGHNSLAVPSLCTMKLVRDYYAGTLPQNGTTCDTGYTFFPGPSQAGSSLVGLDAGDQKLLTSAEAVRELLHDFRRA
ncbi:hypothetical protein B0H17DRAFT_945422, partial [Mycena rosella]